MGAPWKAVRASERPLTGALTATYFLIIGAFTLGKIARDGLFLAELPATYLPYVYVGLAALSAVATAALGRLRAGAAQRRLSWLLAGTSASLLLFSLWSRVAPGSAAIAFYLWTGVYGVALVAEFWLLANETVDSRQARRLFGPIGAGGVLGGLVAAAGATALARLVETSWFLIGAAGLYLAAAALVRRVPGGAREETPAEPTAGMDTGLDARGVLGDEYARLLILVFLVSGIAIGVLDYAFKLVLQSELGDGGEITAALGAFYSAQGVLSILAQVGLTGWVISRFGHRPAANALPAGLLIGSSLALGLPGVLASWAVLGSRLYELAMKFSISRTAWEFLYFPLESQRKAKLKRLVDVVVSRGADALAGLLLLLVNAVLGGTLMQLAAMLVAMTTAWLLLERRLNGAYAREVDRSLRRLVPETEERADELRRLVRADELMDELESSEKSRVLAAMALLERLDATAIVEAAPRLAVHRSEAVRARLFAALSAAGHDPGRFGMLVGVGEAAGLEETADERVAIAAAAATAGGLAAYGHRLAELVDDANADVRRTALRSIGLVGDHELAELVLERLGDARDRSHAAQALVLAGERIVGVLGDRLTDASVGRGTRLALVHALEAIGGGEATDALYRAASLEGDRAVVDAALRSLLSLRRRDGEDRFPSEQIFEDLREETRRNGHRLIQLTALSQASDAETREFVERVLGERSNQSFVRIFRRLALVFPEGPVMSAYRGLKSGQSRTRAQAIEYLETLLPRELAQDLLPLLEAQDDEERREQARKIFGSQPLTLDATLSQLLASREGWLQACGLHVVGRRGMVEQLPKAVELSESDDRIVRQAAVWAVGRLG